MIWNTDLFWSNFTGLSDITTAIQVQRGLDPKKYECFCGRVYKYNNKTADNKKVGVKFYF
jgi:hypothetical protein